MKQALSARGAGPSRPDSPDPGVQALPSNSSTSTTPMALNLAAEPASLL